MRNHDNADLVKQIFEHLSKNDPVYIAAYKLALIFFITYDYIKKTDRAISFVKIFGQRGSVTHSITVIALQNFYNARTLYRYLEEYAACIMLYVRALSPQTESSAAAK